MIYNLLYHLIVVLIFSAVASGIIIDSFAELRAKVRRPPRAASHTCQVTSRLHLFRPCQALAASG